VPLAAFESAEDLVDRLLREDLIARDPLVEDVLRSGRTDLSVRTVRRRYLASTGLPAVTVRQIERARLAAIRLREGVAPVDAAYELGYVDQSHLTHSVRRFIGATPANLRSPGLVPLSLLYKTGVNGSPTVVFDGIPTLERRHDAQDRPRDDDDAQRTAR
jgi:methylphosphotriester-DNA--protein-cysteine methyltransferase